MTRSLPLHPHIPTQELARRSRQEPTPVGARRWQLLALIADKLTVKDAARLVGLNYDYARRFVHRYTQEPRSSSGRPMSTALACCRSSGKYGHQSASDRSL